MINLNLWIQTHIKPSRSWIYRRLTWKSRAYPDFLIIGAQKSGTTSLYYYLLQNPLIIPAIKKEVGYFSHRYYKGEAWYRAHFPRIANVVNKKLTFEATPEYLYHPLAAERIHNAIPYVKLIALLRNPTERAISQYFHEIRYGYENVPLMEALRNEEERMRTAVEKKDYQDRNFYHPAYKARSRYAEQLKRYFSIFPKNNIMVIKSESFYADPQTTVNKVLEFIGMKPDFQIQDAEAQNVGDDYERADNQAYELLDEYFKPYNEELKSLLGQNFTW